MVKQDTKVTAIAFLIFVLVIGAIVVNRVIRSNETFTLRQQYRIEVPSTKVYDNNHDFHKDNARGSCYYFGVEPRELSVRKNGTCACTNQDKGACIKCCKERVKCRKHFDISKDADIFAVNNPDSSLVELQDCVQSCSKDRSQLCYG